MTGDDVKFLQQYVNNSGFVLTDSGAGSPRQETIMFGQLTREALVRFQTANNIYPNVGYFGPITRQIVNSK